MTRPGVVTRWRYWRDAGWSRRDALRIIVGVLVPLNDDGPEPE